MSTRVSITSLIKYIKSNISQDKIGIQQILFDNTLRQVDKWGQCGDIIPDSVRAYFTPYIQNVNKKIIDKSDFLMSLSFIFSLKLDYLKKEYESIDKACVNNIANYLNINIIFINANNGKIYCNSTFNFFRQYILLLCSDELVEPISYKDDYVMNYNCELIKKIMTVHRNEIILLDSNKNIVITFEDLGKYINVSKDDVMINAYTDVALDTDTMPNIVQEVETKPETKPETKHEIKASVKTSVKVSIKMTLDELQTFATKEGLLLEKKSDKTGKMVKKTKQDLIDELVTKDGFSK